MLRKKRATERLKDLAETEGCVRQTEQEQNRANKLLCPQLGGMGDGWKES